MKIKVKYISKIIGYKKKAVYPSTHYSLDFAEFDIPEIDGFPKIYYKKSSGDDFISYDKNTETFFKKISSFTENENIFLFPGEFTKILLSSKTNSQNQIVKKYISEYENTHLIETNFDADNLKEIKSDTGLETKEKIINMLKKIYYDRNHKVFLIKRNEPFFDSTLSIVSSSKSGYYKTFSGKEILDIYEDKEINVDSFSKGAIKENMKYFYFGPAEIFSENNNKGRLIAEINEFWDLVNASKISDLNNQQLLKIASLREKILNKNMENLNEDELVNIIEQCLDVCLNHHGWKNKESFWKKKYLFSNIKEHGDFKL